VSGGRSGAILDTFYGGPVGPLAIVDTMFGQSVPGGRVRWCVVNCLAVLCSLLSFSPYVQMPITIYDPTEPMQPISDYNMTSGLGRTYRYYTGKTLYSFGFGLPFWGNFPQYFDFALSASNVSPCDSINVSATVSVASLPGAQTGGDEVVQVYVNTPQGVGFDVPLHSLQGFARITLGPGHTSQSVSFTLDAWSMSVTDGNGDRVILPGTYNVWIGSGQPSDPRVPAPLFGSFTVTGSSPVVVSDQCTDLARRCYAC
jgi:beta-glucosidase